MRACVQVSGVTQERALELLSMADFNVNRAAEFHFTHPPDEGPSDDNVSLPLVELLDSGDASSSVCSFKVSVALHTHPYILKSTAYCWNL